MATHALKISPKYFSQVECGLKTFEIRKDDRAFEVGDILALLEWDKEYTGNNCKVFVTSLLRADEFSGVSAGHICMSIKCISLDLRRW